MQIPKIPIGDVPPRTALGVTCQMTQEEFEQWEANGGSPELLPVTRTYACMDCDFQTTELAEMKDHQEHQAKHHTLWQRFKRWRES